MPYKSRVDGPSNAKCPFFKSEYVKSITCEGIATDLDGGDILMRFKNEKEKNDWISKHCYYYPNSCLLCKALNEKWGIYGETD